MAVTYSLTIAAGAALDVSIDGARVTNSAGRPVTMPDRITANKTYSVEAGRIRVSCKRAGVELATHDGPAYLAMPADDSKTLTPISVDTGLNAGGGDVAIVSSGDVNVRPAGDFYVLAEENITLETYDAGAMTLIADASFNITVPTGDITVTATLGDILLEPAAGAVALYGATGLTAAARPAIDTVTNEATLVTQFNLLRTALIALGVITDGD